MQLDLAVVVHTALMREVRRAVGTDRGGSRVRTQPTNDELVHSNDVSV